MASKVYPRTETLSSILPPIVCASQKDLSVEGRSGGSFDSTVVGTNTPLSFDSYLPLSGSETSSSVKFIPADPFAQQVLEAKPPNFAKPQARFRRNVYGTEIASVREVESGNISMKDVHDVIEMVVPEAAVACFSIQPETRMANFMQATRDEISKFRAIEITFLLVESNEVCFDKVIEILNHHSNSNSGVVLPVFMEQFGIHEYVKMSKKISALVQSGADDVVFLPTNIVDLKNTISASVAKGMAHRRIRLESEQRFRSVSKQCDQLFWQIAHEIMPDIPEERLNLSEIPGKRIGNVSLVSKLGEGAFGAVHKCKNTETGQDCAVKVLPKASIKSHRQLQQIVTEYAVLREADHTNIVSGINFVHGVKNLYIFMEIAGARNLYSVIREQGVGGLPWATIQQFIVQISAGVAHLHEKAYAHCDLKPENMTVSSDGCIKLVDFGQALDVTQGVPALKVPRGTMPFVPPEVLYLSRQWDPIASDLWQVGVVFFEMLCGNDSFVRLVGWLGEDLMSQERLSERADELVARFNSTNKGNTLAAIPQMCNTPPPCVAMELLTDMLVLEPEKRLPAKCVAPRFDQ